MNPWVAGLEAAFDPQSLLFLMIGVLVGMMVGGLPGLSATMAVAILLPFTFGLEPVPGLMLLLGIYNAAVYSGSIPAILMRVPGTPASAATAIDGYPMTQQGRAGEALTVSLVASAVGGLVGGVLLAFFAPEFANFALSFGAAELFMVSVFALAIIASLSEGALVKGLISGLLGMGIATVGLDPISGVTRFSFGQTQLTGGIEFIPVLIGLFGVAEALSRFEKLGEGLDVRDTLGRLRFSLGSLRKLLPTTAGSSLIGFVVGVLPGTGGDISSFVAYNETRRFARDKDSFGSGNSQGVAAADSANNAAVPGTLALTLTLGIPGNATAAILLGAITVHGLRPGPQLFTGSPDLVYGIFVGAVLAYVFILILGLIGIRFWAQILRVPTQYLWPIILVLSVVGAYALRSNPFDVLVTILAGLLGYFMLKGGFPPAPLVIGLIVGPIAESGFRRAMITVGGGYEWLLQPIPLVLLILTLASILFSIYRSWRMRHQAS